MGTLRRGALLVIATWVSAGALMLSTAEAAGPWKAQVVDAETGKPLEGVVVLAYWIKYTGTIAGWAGGEFYDSEEVVTGADGRFVIPARSTFTLLPWKKLSREFVIVKPGYGQWRFQGSEAWPRDVVEQKAHVKKAWEQFEGAGAVIELSPLKTREEHLEFSRSFGSPPLVPAERTKRLREAEDVERAYLGFRKMHERKP